MKVMSSIFCALGKGGVGALVDKLHLATETYKYSNVSRDYQSKVAGW